LRQEMNYMVAHSLHRHSESLMNEIERVAHRIVQEVMKDQYSSLGPILGSHRGEAPLQSRPPLPFSLTAPELRSSPIYIVYKIGGDPGEGQFLREPPKEILHGYMCVYIPDDVNQTHSRQLANTWASGTDAEKQAWLSKYAIGLSAEPSALGILGVEQIGAILRDLFGIWPKSKAIGYSKPYLSDYDLIPLPPKYRLPEFSKFNGSEGSSSIEHVSRYLTQLGMISVSDPLRVRFFCQSLTGPAFGWYTSLAPESIRTWRQLEDQFHIQYHSEAAEAGIADLAQVKQKRGETVSEYVQRFREVKNRCYSSRITEKEAVDLAVLGLAKPIKDLAFQLEFSSLAHMMQKLTTYKHYHPELYQEKFKRQVNVAQTDDSDDSGEEQEVAVAEWVRRANPVSCKWVTQKGPVKGFDFDVSKVEQMFDLLLKEKQLKLPENHKFPMTQELQGRPYCKWHHSFTHPTSDCKELHQQIQSAIEQGRLILAQHTMKVDSQPLPQANVVGLTGPSHGRQNFAFQINMAGPMRRHGKLQREAVFGKRPRDKDKSEQQHITEEQVCHICNQLPPSDRLLEKYEYQYKLRRRYESEEEEYEHHTGRTLGRRQAVRDHWHCPFFRYFWNSSMS